jgi:hypothetical protein
VSDDRKFFVTTVTIKVLSEDAPWDGDLRWLGHDITAEGEFVGDLVGEEVAEVSEAEMAQALIDAGSEPGFFGIGESA